MAGSTPLHRQKGCRSKTPTFILKFKLLSVLVGSTEELTLREEDFSRTGASGR
jgi:hypothetical protein